MRRVSLLFVASLAIILLMVNTVSSSPEETGWNCCCAYRPMEGGGFCYAHCDQGNFLYMTEEECLKEEPGLPGYKFHFIEGCESCDECPNSKLTAKCLDPGKTIEIVIPKEGEGMGDKAFRITVDNPTCWDRTVDYIHEWLREPEDTLVSGLLLPFPVVKSGKSRPFNAPHVFVGPDATPGLYGMQITWRVKETGETFTTDPWVLLITEEVPVFPSWYAMMAAAVAAGGLGYLTSRRLLKRA